MKRYSIFFLASLGCCILSFKLLGNTLTVSLSTDTNDSGTLRTAILQALPGDSISFTPTVTSITLSNPLPAITQSSLTISSDHLVTIDGNLNQFQIFSMVNGTLTLENLVLQNGLSKGGNGGAADSSGGGGGGGAGGGGGLYIHTKSNVFLNGVTLQNNEAQGGDGGSGAGGINSGGGGGGFGCLAADTNKRGNGGNGDLSINNGSGGGGGGNTAGGNGGTSAPNGAGQPGGSTATTGNPASPKNIIGGGGGGGSGNGSAGGSAQVSTFATTSTPTSNLGAPSNGTDYGGGGAGMGGAGNGPVPPPSSLPHAGIGGLGIGIDGYFGGGGGGGVGNIGASGTGDGGAGYGTGGGGGAYTGAGGSGGVAGGGGGGSGFRNAGYAGGIGGFGAGGGGIKNGEVAPSIFGGGSGGSGNGITPGVGGGGGGGAGMGGNIFVQDQATLTIGDSLIGASSISGGIAVGGTAGISGGTTAAEAGNVFGPDLFIRSGGTVTFTHSGILVLAQPIASNQYVGGQAVAGQGGLIMNGSGTLSLGGANTYTASTTIQSGTVVVSNDMNLGSASNSLTIGSGTLQTTGSFSSPRAVSLTGAASINTNSATTLTLTSPIAGSGSLTKQGLGTLILSPTSASTYTGGTTISAGKLQIQSDTALGKAATKVTMADGSTLSVTVPATPGIIGSNRSFVLEGAATFNITTLAPDITPTTFVIGGSITGSGQLIKTGNQTLFLLGNNSYSGGTLVNTGILAGDTASLQGNITVNNPATLVFLQVASGTYSGSLSGNGTLQIGNLSTSPFPLVSFSGDSSGFTGPTQILTSGVLAVNGSLANSPFTISAGGLLQGTGTTGSIDNSGTIQPGNNSASTLHVNGNVVFEPGSNFIVELDPTTASLLAATGTASLNGTLSLITPASGFYGLGNRYTILTAAGGRIGSFFFTPSPNFTMSVEYFPTSVVLNVTVNQPFLNFPYQNPNERSVGENIDELVAAGDLTEGSPLGQAINALIGLSDDSINEALDQMHPAAFSAFAEIQAALGAQMLSMFHRRPVPHCVCSNGVRFWVDTFGNWLKEKNIGYELGFNANSKGAVVGFDTEITDGWVIGIGGLWNKTHMQWRRGRGNASILGYYAGAYTDYFADNFYIGLSWLQGFDNCTSSRHINFSTIHEKAHATRRNRETIGQLATAVFFGPDACFAFPYFNLDYFFLKEGKAVENGAPGLNLEVREHSGSTLRTEAGFAVQVQDTNKNSTMCIAPLFGLGWAMELPLNRGPYNSKFEGEPIPFNVQGWDYTWQLFTLRFGFTMTYKCVSVYGGYVAEMSPLESTPFFDQRGDIRLEIGW